MMLRTTFIILICLISTLAACYSTGSIASYVDDRYFKESPKIVIQENHYYLKFVYSDSERAYGFAMTTQSKIRNDSLIFYLPVTTSSFNMRGKTQLEEITDSYEIRLIKKRNVFWEEPDEKLVLMKIEE